jgi:NADPH:quinone reductase-like Zn-dependent oxidoreductase
MPIAVVATGYGGVENLSVIEAEPGEPGPGEVVLDVRAAGVNPADVKLYGGLFGTDPARLPLRLGSEVAGVVRAVGPDAVGPTGPVAAGDEVIGFRVAGGYASAVRVPASAIVPKPAALSWAQAAGLMLTGTTAVHALTVAHPEPGEALLVHGAAGGVGLMLVQVAVARGVRVVGTAAPTHHDLLRRLGAVPVAYGDGVGERVRAAAPDGLAAAVDTAGTTEAVDVSVALVPDRSRIVTIAAFDYGAEQGIVRIGGGPGADPGTEIRDAARLELVRLVEQGALTVEVAATFPLVDVAQAHGLLTARHAPGKIVLIPGRGDGQG